MTNGLHQAFHPLSDYQHRGAYRLLPMRFTALDSERVAITSVGGDLVVAGKSDLHDLVGYRLAIGSPRYDDFKAKHLLVDDESDACLELLAAKYRTRQSHLPDFTSLHLFVVTLRCDHSCHYCQVSRVSEDRTAFDMSKATASKAIDLVLQSPSVLCKIEFQGGEPLLNFPLIVYIVEELKMRAPDRIFQFVIATNLAPLTDDMLDFFAKHQVFISTSLDGPRALHNQNRSRSGNNSYDRAADGIRRVRTRLGPNAVSALMTCTNESLDQPEAIIDEYVALEFSAIFLRHLSRYGFAAKSGGRHAYAVDEFIAFYRRSLAYIFDLNRRGTRIYEIYTRLLLQRILTPYPTAYVDLQSPAGIGISAIAYNYNGEVYASDEGRMLAEMGDFTFRMGNVHKNSYDQLFLDSPLLGIIHRTMSEGIPGCSDCAFQPYCGSDPVFHHRTQGDVIGHRPTSEFCRRNMEMIRHIVRLLEDDPESARILRSWM